MSEEIIELTLPSRIGAVADAAAAVAESLNRWRLTEEAAFGIDLAVREAVTNAVLHGNEQDETRPVDLKIKSIQGSVEITVRDRGEGFNPASVPDPTEEQNILKASGRGILFMRTFMDKVEWSMHPEGGTLVRMTKQV